MLSLNIASRPEIIFWFSNFSKMLNFGSALTFEKEQQEIRTVPQERAAAYRICFPPLP